MTYGFVTVLAWVLTQEPEAPAPSPAPVEQPAGEASGEPAAAATKAPAEAPALRRGPPEELTRLLLKLKDAPVGPARQALMEEIQKKYAAMVPSGDIDVAKYRELSEGDQAKVIARDFLSDLLSGNATGAASRCGVPFMLEDHRFEHAEELRTEWARHLRGKRTDLLSVYDLEVFTPAEMEKKYGRPPPRLSSWSWRSQGVLVVVANVSGRAAVLLMRPFGAVWQVVGYHD